MRQLFENDIEWGFEWGFKRGIRRHLLATSLAKGSHGKARWTEMDENTPGQSDFSEPKELRGK